MARVSIISNGKNQNHSPSDKMQREEQSRHFCDILPNAHNLNVVIWTLKINPYQRHSNLSAVFKSVKVVNVSGRLSNLKNEVD